MMLHQDNLRRSDGIKDHFEEVKRVSERVIEGSTRNVERGYVELETLVADVEAEKLHSEEQERLVVQLQAEKTKLELQRHRDRTGYESAAQTSRETQKRLEATLDRNRQLNAVIDKMRENEKQLLLENERLRKTGRPTGADKRQLQESISHATIEHLEKELDFWRTEAGRPSLNSESEISDPKSSRRPVKKLRDAEVENLKQEKLQMKNLLNNLECQVSEIQNNVIRISSERQKFKDLYLDARQQLECCHGDRVGQDRCVVELRDTNENLGREVHRLAQQVEILLKDNRDTELRNQELMTSTERASVEHRAEMEVVREASRRAESENAELEARSRTLRTSVHDLEQELASLEERLRENETERKEQTLELTCLRQKLSVTQTELESRTDKTNELYRSINEKDEKLGQMLQHEKTIDLQSIQQENDNQKSLEKIQQLTNELQKQHTSYSAHLVKLDNSLQNAEQIIAAKVKLITSLELRLAECDHGDAVAKQQLMELRQHLQSRDHQLELSNNKYNELHDSKAFLEVHVRQLTSSSDGLQREVIEQTTELGQLRAQLEVANRQLEERERLVDCCRDSARRTEIEQQDEQRRLTAKLGQLQQDQRQKSAYIASLVCVVEEKEHKIAGLHRELENRDLQTKGLNEKVTEFEDSLVATSSRSGALEQEIGNLRSANRRLKRQKEHLDQQMSEKNVVIGQMEAQMGVLRPRTRVTLNSNSKSRVEEESINQESSSALDHNRTSYSNSEFLRSNRAYQNENQRQPILDFCA